MHVIFNTKNKTFYSASAPEEWVVDASIATRIDDLEAAHVLARRVGGLVCLDHWSVNKSSSRPLAMLDYTALATCTLGVIISATMWNVDRFVAGLSLMSMSLVAISLLRVSSARKMSCNRSAPDGGRQPIN